MTRFILSHGTIIKASGKFITRQKKGGESYRVFVTKLGDSTYPEQYVKESLNDFPEHILRKESEYCRELLKEDEEFRCMKDGSTFRLKAFFRSVDEMTDAQVLGEYFDVPAASILLPYSI